MLEARCGAIRKLEEGLFLVAQLARGLSSSVHHSDFSGGSLADRRLWFVPTASILKSSDFLTIGTMAAQLAYLRLTRFRRPGGFPSLALQVSPERKRSSFARQRCFVDFERKWPNEGEQFLKCSRFMREDQNRAKIGSKPPFSAKTKRLEIYEIPPSSELHLSSVLSRISCTKGV